MITITLSGGFPTQAIASNKFVISIPQHKAPDFISKLRESVKRTKQRNIKVALAQVLNSGVGLGMELPPTTSLKWYAIIVNTKCHNGAVSRQTRRKWMINRESWVM